MSEKLFENKLVLLDTVNHAENTTTNGNIDFKTTSLIEMEIISNDFSSLKSKSSEIELFTLGMLKPDCLDRKLEHEAFRRIKSVGFEIAYSKKITLTESDVRSLYSRCQDKEFFERMIEFLTSSESIVFIAKHIKKDAIDRMNILVGFTEPSKAEFGTLRELGKNVQCNIAHSSDSIASFKKESSYFFSESELIQAGLDIKFYN
jgi:nucleoside-diphosphate kinase